MGLFDAIFGSSKKEQEQPIRDKLKKRKDFEKVLKIRLAEIDRYKEILTTGQGDELYSCYMIADDSMDVIQIRYSMDGGLKELQKIYMDSFDYFLRDNSCDNPVYDDILNRISLGILLNIPDENFMQLVDYVQRLDEEAKPADWTPDLLLWFLLNSRLKDNEKRTHAQKLGFPRECKGAIQSNASHRQ